MKWKAILCGALLTVATASPAFAVVSGQLNLDGGSNQVTVGLTTIDWNPLGGGTGGFVVGGGTNVTCAGCPIPIGSAGTIKDLPPVPVADFMTFAMVSSLHYDLSTVGPGSANTNCATANAVGLSCSPFVGSPFVLTFASPTQTTITLSAAGIARDGTLPNSNWSGLFTAQIPNMTPASIQTFFGCTPGMGVGGCSNLAGTITNTYSGSFVATVTEIPIPEPATLTLLGLGLVGAGIRARRRRQ